MSFYLCSDTVQYREICLVAFVFCLLSSLSLLFNFLHISFPSPFPIILELVGIFIYFLWLWQDGRKYVVSGRTEPHFTLPKDMSNVGLGGRTRLPFFLFAAPNTDGFLVGLTATHLEMYDSNKALAWSLPTLDVTKTTRRIKGAVGFSSPRGGLHKLTLQTNQRTFEFTFEKASHVETFRRLIVYQQERLRSRPSLSALSLRFIEELELPSHSWLIPFSDLKMQESIGAGTCSTVRRALWQGQTVAVKRIAFSSEPEDRQAIRKEIECLM